MEIEIGEYVRTKDGYIAKAVERDTTNWLFFDNSIMEICGDRFITLNPLEQKEIVVAHSKNIIDLLEEGDFVNGYKVIEIGEYEPIGDVLQKYLKIDCSKLFNVIYEKDIKTILTKEQMEANQYVVK